MKIEKELTKRSQQKATKYQPTVAQKRLLEILLNPEHRLKSVTEICGLANCTRNVYYDAFEKQPFVDYFAKQSKSLINKARAAIINSSIRQAIRGNATHTKLLLTMSGDYADRQIFPDKHGNPQPISPRNEISPMEAAARIAYLLQIAIENKKKAEAKKKQDEKGGKS